MSKKVKKKIATHKRSRIKPSKSKFSLIKNEIKNQDKAASVKPPKQTDNFDKNTKA